MASHSFSRLRKPKSIRVLIARYYDFVVDNNGVSIRGVFWIVPRCHGINTRTRCPERDQWSTLRRQVVEVPVAALTAQHTKRHSNSAQGSFQRRPARDYATTSREKNKSTEGLDGIALSHPTHRSQLDRHSTGNGRETEGRALAVCFGGQSGDMVCTQAATTAPLSSYLVAVSIRSGGERSATGSQDLRRGRGRRCDREDGRVVLFGRMAECEDGERRWCKSRRRVCTSRAGEEFCCPGGWNHYADCSLCTDGQQFFYVGRYKATRTSAASAVGCALLELTGTPGAIRSYGGAVRRLGRACSILYS